MICMIRLARACQFEGMARGLALTLTPPAAPRHQARRFGAVPMSARAAASSAVPRMLACRALIAVLVVAGDPGHKLLSLGAGLVLSFLLEIIGFVAAKRGRQPTAMEDLHLSVLPHPVGEAEIM